MTDAETLLTKMNVYDQLGLLAVGGVAMIVVWFDALVFGVSPETLPCPGSFAAKLVIAYFLGHLIQSVANVMVKENKTEFSADHAAALKAAARRHGLKPFNADAVFQVCYMLSLASDVTGHVQLFNANYSMYRGWFVAFSANAAFFLIVFAMSCGERPYAVAAVVSATAAWLMRRRAGRYYEYTRNKAMLTYHLFAKKPS